MAGSRRVQLAAAVGPAPVVAGLVLGRDRPQVPLAGDQHRAGHLGPGGEREPLGEGIRPRASGRDLDCLDTGGAGDRVGRAGELAGAAADQEAEVCGAVPGVHEEVADLPGGPRAVRMGGDPGGHERSGCRLR